MNGWVHGREQLVTNNCERPKLVCDLFIFNKVNSRLLLQCHLLPYILGFSGQRRDCKVSAPSEPPGCRAVTIVITKGAGNVGQEGGQVINDPALHTNVCTPAEGSIGLYDESHIPFPGIQSTSHPSSSYFPSEVLFFPGSPGRVFQPIPVPTSSCKTSHLLQECRPAPCLV